MACDASQPLDKHTTWASVLAARLLCLASRSPYLSVAGNTRWFGVSHDSAKWAIYVGRSSTHRCRSREVVIAERYVAAMVEYGDLVTGAEHRKAKIALLLKRRGGTCALCGDPLPDDFSLIEIDHIEPQARVGSKALKNCQLVHVECNRKKSSR
ncbi:MAG: hypothetical protein F4Y27_07070 [Acidimicrobiaceae bacterium]|nr:hypothetical protein [Acidimicrobiaceae bacterium]MYA74420.1 hypothetical protein [Acidimicrobiaceae bacterium]MYC43441.1 hypothetical protein [Acidimicrobiaceae bacterium]MYG55845.1 hypothetical protein [Acidimicrobiaceae bacterium]MYH87703.1 hypothetical protein [Acidimicrobiaceae bacterium]